MVVSVLALAGLFAFSLLAVGGNLEPTAPPAPTMKTLDEVEPRIPISSLPYIISASGSYYLTGDLELSDPRSNGITVNVTNVTIDLMGYSLIGPGAASGINCGIYMNMWRDVEIRNGMVRSFGSHGIYETNNSDDGGGHRAVNIRAIGNGGIGINLKGPGNLVNKCFVLGNSSGGIAVGDALEHRGASIVSENVVKGNGGNGISAGEGSMVTGNTVSSGYGDGISVQENCAVTANTVYLNQGDGIEVLSRCKVSGNTCGENGRWTADGAGIHVTGSANQIEHNHVIGNDRGIDVDSIVNIIIKNTASENTTNYDIVLGNRVGPIVSDPSISTNPWANFQF